MTAPAGDGLSLGHAISAARVPRCRRVAKPCVDTHAHARLGGVCGDAVTPYAMTQMARNDAETAWRGACQGRRSHRCPLQVELSGAAIALLAVQAITRGASSRSGSMEWLTGRCLPAGGSRDVAAFRLTVCPREMPCWGLMACGRWAMVQVTARLRCPVREEWVETTEMWNWEQGRLEYFQFDELRKVARFGLAHDLRTATRRDLADAVGLPFLPDAAAYKPWRNYGRLFQIAMIAIPHGDGARLTALGQLLAEDGKVTSDEYLHFLAQATTQPSPALSTWDRAAQLRYPLLFALRFILARATQDQRTTDIADIINSYRLSEFCGDEDQEAFLGVLDAYTSRPLDRSDARQAAESVKVLAQLSYLTATTSRVTVSLTPSDAAALFDDLKPVCGRPLADGENEVDRRAALFLSAKADIETDYPATVLSSISEAGFDGAIQEGRRVRRTHMSIERNNIIREMFFKQKPGHFCDLCGMDTRQVYPWTDRLLEVHHLLPLCSGARTSKDGTLLEDLVANCPSCHRAVHRYYDKWLARANRLDFADAGEAREAYSAAKREHRGRGRLEAV